MWARTGGDVARGEVRGDAAVVLAVVGEERRRPEEVGDALLHDRAEVEVVAADRDDHHRHVVAGRELLQHLRLAEVAGAVVVEVEAGLEVAVAVGEGRRLRAGAGEVHAVHPSPDVGLGRLAAVAAGNHLRGVAGVVVVRRRAQRVGVRRRGVRAARPPAGLAGDVGVTHRDHPGSAGAGTVRRRGRGGERETAQGERGRDEGGEDCSSGLTDAAERRQRCLLRRLALPSSPA